MAHFLMAGIFGTIAVGVIYAAWAYARNAPTLRSRRYRVHLIFHAVQYIPLIAVAVFCVSAEDMIPRGGDAKMWGLILTVSCTALATLLFQLGPMQILRKIVENDIGLPGR
jgi:hypothetical protein